MAEEFVNVDIAVDEQTLADDAVSNLQAAWPSWEPNDGDLEVVMIETLAAMAADVAEVAASVPAAIFRDYGTKLLGVAYQDGVEATTTLTFTVPDAAGYLIPAGTEVDIDGYAFLVDDDTVVDPGETTVAGVPVSCSVVGVEANGLGDNASMISALAFVTNVAVDDPTAGGVDAETDDEYLDRLNLALRLRARSLVTARDYELVALQQDGIARATAATTGERAVRVAVTDADGQVVSTAIKNELQALYNELRLVNVQPSIVDPTYTSVDVGYVVKRYAGFEAADLETRIDAAIAGYLSPASWGVPRTTGDIDTAQWLNDPVVRQYKLIDLIGNVEGVDYVDAVTLSGATNLVTNSSFETNTTGYAQNAASGSLTRDTTANGAHSGSAFAEQDNPGSNSDEGVKTDEIAVTASESYTASVWLRGTVGSENVTVELAEYTSGSTLVGETSESTYLTTDWQRIQVTRAFGATGEKARIIVRGTNTEAMTFYLDDFALVNEGDVVLNADGDLEIPGEVALPEAGTITGAVI